MGMASESTVGAGKIADAELVALVRQGDRGAGAEFLRRHADLLRQRVRRRLRRSGRRLFDSQEIISTVSRRFDRMVSSGAVRAPNPASLIGLMVEIADHSVVDKARIIDRIDRVEGEESGFAAALRHRVAVAEQAEPDGGENVLARVFEGMRSHEDREILGLWLRGCPLKAIASEFSVNADAMRQRWKRIRSDCEAILARESAE